MEQIEKLKLYRVLKDHLTIGWLHTCTYHPDDLFTYMGYTPFYGNIRYGHANNYGCRQYEEGKYFFLFPEDALFCSNILLNGECFTAKIVEYEFPLDYVFYNIGNGRYENGYCSPRYYINECTIGKSFFTGEKCSSEDIDIELKKAAIKKSFDEICEIVDDDVMKKYFEEEGLFKKIEKKLTMREKQFINASTEIIKSNEITGRTWTIINRGFGKTNVKPINIEYLANKGLILDYSEDAKKFRDEVVYLLSSDGSGPNEAKKLIKEYCFKNKNIKL